MMRKSDAMHLATTRRQHMDKVYGTRQTRGGFVRRFNAKFGLTKQASHIQRPYTPECKIKRLGSRGRSPR